MKSRKTEFLLEEKANTFWSNSQSKSTQKCHFLQEPIGTKEQKSEKYFRYWNYPTQLKSSTITRFKEVKHTVRVCAGNTQLYKMIFHIFKAEFQKSLKIQ